MPADKRADPAASIRSRSAWSGSSVGLNWSGERVVSVCIPLTTPFVLDGAADLMLHGVVEVAG